MGLIGFGTVCSLLAKLIYSVQAPSLYGGLAPFEKPWFQVFTMFFGMSICILLDLPRPRGPQQQHQTRSNSVWIIAIPAVLDLFATACGTTGLLYTTVSVYQMLRGAMLVWTALLSVMFLGRKLTFSNYAGIALCVSGIVLVGLANVAADVDSEEQSQTMFGFVIILFGQVLQAAQVVLEEFLLRNLQMSSIRVVAWEGLFGMLHCVVWVFPILYLLKGRDHGHVEDIVDTMHMFSHSWMIVLVLFSDMTMMLFYNVFGMEVTDSLSAVYRVVIETLRTLCVWLIDLFIYYVLSDGKLGESWTPYSPVQLIGFTLMVLGTILYNYNNLVAERKPATAKSTEELPILHPTGIVNEVTEYNAAQAAPKDVVSEISHPLAVDEEQFEEDEEDEEQVGSYYGHTVGSVAHSPYLVVSATTPNSLTGSLRRRSGFLGTSPRSS